MTIPVIQAGITAHQSPIEVVLGTALAGAVALRAYIDRSPSERDSTRAQEESLDTPTASAAETPA